MVEKSENFELIIFDHLINICMLSTKKQILHKKQILQKEAESAGKKQNLQEKAESAMVLFSHNFIRMDT